MTPDREDPRQARERQKIDELIEHLRREPETFHPALALAFRYQIAITTGTLDIGELVASSQEIEMAIEAGEQSIKACEATINDLHRFAPQPRRDRPPVGF